mgnify:CR=1 FL=1
MSEVLLQSKLKRLKISFNKEGNKTIIGKSKIDKTTLFGLVLFPLFTAIIAFILMVNTGFLYGKAVVFIIGLVLFAIFNFGRIGKKIGLNSSIKILENNAIKIKNNKELKKYDKKNTIDFYYEIKEVNISKEIVYQGTVFLKDIDNNTIQILGFDDEDEKLLKDDLNWLISYFKQFTRI